MRRLHGGGAIGALAMGWYLPDDVSMIFSTGKQNDVPLITGGTADEGGLGPTATRPQTAAAFKEWASRTLDARADAFMKVYPATSDAEVGKAFHDADRDANLAGHRTWVQLQARTGKSKSYLYLFSYGTTPRGAFHGSELALLFNVSSTGSI